MDITETVYASTREEWRTWLEGNHATSSEVWLISYRKGSGRPSLPYDVAVEEALCFGWIDSIRKSVDDSRYAQRFSPRLPGSAYSQTNKERLARLAKEGRLAPALQDDLENHRPEEYEIPEDIVAALKSNQSAWEFFEGTSPSYQRIRAAYVDVARDRPEEYKRRLVNLIRKCADRKQFGYHIEDFY
jgi:uncharacterized protein YdeI (YjbR/CyaY-like superfamily)